MVLPVADESYSISRCCLGKGFIALQSEMRNHTLGSQGRDRSREESRPEESRAGSDDEGQKAGREKRWLIQGEANLPLTPLPEREGLQTRWLRNPDSKSDHPLKWARAARHPAKKNPSSVKVNKMRISNKCIYTHKHVLWSDFSQILTPGKTRSGVSLNTLPHRAKSDDVAVKGYQSERSEEEAIPHLVIQPVVTCTHTHF